MKWIQKLKNVYFKTPIFTTLLASLLSALFISFGITLYYLLSSSSFYTVLELFFLTLFYFPLTLTAVLTVENVILLFLPPLTQQEEQKVKSWEIFALVIGFLFSIVGAYISNITMSDWDASLYNTLIHTPIASDHLLTVIVLSILAGISYIILRFVPLRKLPPLFAVLCISGLYLGMGLTIVFGIQMSNPYHDTLLLLVVFPINLVIIGIRTLKYLMQQQVPKKIPVSGKLQSLKRLLNSVHYWPWLALILMLPLLGLILSILLLFGQEPDSLIKAWTETADWTFSQKIAPPNVIHDGHYLCTVAAGGHREIVRPIRTGKRHGHEVIVNRQLCVANAFEQLIEERTPTFHRIVRTTYDTIGYPIANHIHSPFVADGIYFIMKPLEWFFLIVLYLLDTEPENRIATQYPHTDLDVMRNKMR